MTPRNQIVTAGKHLLSLINPDPVDVVTPKGHYLLTPYDKQPIYIVMLKSGDFVFLTLQQKLLSYGVPVTLEPLVEQSKPFKIDLQSTKKPIGHLWPFRKESYAYLYQLALHSNKSFQSNKVAGILRKLQLQRTKIKVNWDQALVLRSIATAHGFNFVWKRSYYRVTNKVPKRSKLSFICIYKTSPTMRVSIRNSYQRFLTSGFPLTY